MELIEQSKIDEFEMERSGVRVRIKKGGNAEARPSAEVVKLPLSPVSEAPAEEPASAGEAEREATPYLFKAPIVGTFYTAPKPDAEALIRVGDRVQKGEVLCIIEAMKLFNQIESDVEGEIASILVENGQPVEYGQPLFEIRLAS